ncbi:MAG: heparan-alpha-glucosaminide N-acetyltransferase domain-containing protein [Pirellula sp.]
MDLPHKQETLPKQQTERVRFRSLDVFRGATVALMILVNNPGSWSAMYKPLSHAKWHGCTPTDLVFPFFLFAVGNALALVMRNVSQLPSQKFWWRVAKRTSLIFLIGLVLNMSPFVRWDEQNQLVFKGWSDLRYLGVLQRIAICFGGASVIIWMCGKGNCPGTVLWTAIGILVGYCLACMLAGEPGNPYSLEGYFGTTLDRYLLGEKHLYRGEGVPFDPEGIASTVPAIAQVMLGWWVGQKIATSKNRPELIANLFVWATGFLMIAYAWQLEMPVNKKIWTSSFVLLTTGLAIMGLATLVYIIDARPANDNLQAESWRMAWLPFFEVFGKNPLFIFVLSGLVPRFFDLIRWQSATQNVGTPAWTTPLSGLKNLFLGLGDDPRVGSVLYSIALLSVYWLIARWLDRNRIHIRV